MNDQWDLVFHQQAVNSIRTARGREKTALSKALDELLRNPYRDADYQECDSNGRPLRVILAGPWAITFWLDHYTKEIRIVTLENAG